MASFSTQLQTILGRALDEGTFDRRVLEGLTVRAPRTPTFYLLPKVHKDAVNPPGRPIVSGIDGLCDPVCKFIDFYLKPLVETLPSYIRDTTDVLSRVDGVLVDPGVLLVTTDVQTLYTCIDHEHGLAAVRLFLGASDLGGPMCDLVLELLGFVLTHNFFVFKDIFYLQKRGTAMGAACAPSYANLFLGAWERSIFGDGGVQAADHVLCWVRYIDDILFLWGGTTQQLEEFMSRLNDNQLNIKLTYQFDHQRIDFLDVTFEIDEARQIQTDMFRKSTSVNALLHASSAHNYSTIGAVPVGQFLRMRRICSTDNRFPAQAEDLRGRFEARGYSRRSIRRGFERARKTPRRDLMYPKNNKRDTPTEGDRVRFITTYNHEWPKMREILKKHWPVLLTEPALASVLGDFPSMTARRSPNLANHLVRSHYVPPPTNPFGTRGPMLSSFKCGHCVACANITRTSTFTSSDGLKTYDIRQHITCGTSNVIYYATCGCSLIYVGLTSREFRTRVREHVRDIRNA
ncbi:unnamed protein product [Ranitomeya imitator]|uniref:Helix-turn-helix domain-containing protein n=1 Tax=Ranitomeya imitator TaxID=111125 RepID=A0ABN9L643_9NEOB|nr:unnamed protein product [Ranitomeya imitator]